MSDLGFYIIFGVLLMASKDYAIFEVIYASSGVLGLIGFTHF